MGQDGSGLPARPWYVSAVLAVVAVTLLLLGAWAFARVRSPYPFYGTAYPAGTAAAAISGAVWTGPFTFTPGQNGQVTAVFFGFTHCANVCPVTLAYLNRVRAALSDEERARFRILLVSVDPDRDTPRLLRDYVNYFGGDAVGLRVPEPALGAAARAYGVSYQKADGTPDGYQINHTTATYLIDGRGHLRVLWDSTQLPQVARVTADVRRVLETP